MIESAWTRFIPPDGQTLEGWDSNLVDWYLRVLDSRKEKLLRASRHVVADAYFSKSNFVEGLHGMGFALVSRFRNDAVLFYPTLHTIAGKGCGKAFLQLQRFPDHGEPGKGAGKEKRDTLLDGLM